MLSTWTLARFLAWFCTIILTKHDLMTSGLPELPKENYLSISTKRLASKTHEDVTKTKGNFVYSPYGLSYAMVLLLRHAGGETRSEIVKAIQMGGINSGEIFETHKMLASLRKPFHMSSFLAYDVNVQLFPTYGDGLPQPEIYKLNFTGVEHWTTGHNIKKSLTTKEKINLWLDLGGFIPMFLNSDYELKPPSLLVNAIALRIYWGMFEKAFNKMEQQLPFRNIGGPEKNVRMLTLEGTFKFKTFDFASILELPYGDNDQYYIYIILPETPDKLKKVEDEIFAETHAIAYGMEDKYLQVTIPMFKLDTFFNLNETLKALGMRKAFIKGESELSEISKKSGAFLGDVLQRAAVEFGDRSDDIHYAKPNLVEKSRTFLVDQPFFFVIRSKEYEVTLFRGRVERID